MYFFKIITIKHFVNISEGILNVTVPLSIHTTFPVLTLVLNRPNGKLEHKIQSSRRFELHANVNKAYLNEHW